MNKRVMPTMKYRRGYSPGTTLSRIEATVNQLSRQAQTEVQSVLEYLLLQYASASVRVEEETWSSNSVEAMLSSIPPDDRQDVDEFIFIEKWQ